MYLVNAALRTWYCHAAKLSAGTKRKHQADIEQFNFHEYSLIVKLLLLIMITISVTIILSVQQL